MNALMTHSLPTLLLGFFIKITLLLLAAGALGCLLRRASAATRHLVWSVALGSVLLMPILSLSLPRWNVAWGHVSAAAPPTPMAVPQAPFLPLAPTDAPAVSHAAPPSAPASEKSESLPVVAPVSRVVPVPTSRHQFSTFPLLLGISLFVWLIGVLSVLCQLFDGLRRLARIERRSIPLEHGALQMAEDIRGRTGLRRPVRFLRATEASTIAVPVTWGVFRPVVLLPAQSSTWSEGCLRAAILHELAHIQRWDWPTQLMSRLACALYWWHPLVWWAARQAREESERACDDLVLGAGIRAADYAQRLVEVVRSMPEGPSSRAVAIAMAQPSEVEGRLRAVLAKGNSRSPLTIKWMIGSFALVLLLVLPLATLRLTPAARAQGIPAAGQRGAAGAASPMVTVADGYVNIVNGDRAVFPNGYEVSLVAVTRAVQTGPEWDMFGGPWWRPNGTFIAPQSGGLDGHWHWSTAHTHGLPPFIFKIAFRAPASAWKHGESSSPGFYEQFLGALKHDDQAVEGNLVISGLHPTVRDITSPLVDDSAPQLFGGNVGGTRCAELYPTGTRTCTIRCGVAAGPWHTVSRHPFAQTPSSVTTEAFVTSLLSSTAHDFTDVTLTLDDRPRETSLDVRGKRHVFYFLGAAGRLGNVARRFVAVDRTGRVIPLNEVGTQRVELAFGRQSDVTKWNPTLDLARVKEFRLQTCPYLTAEFQNVQLQPALAAGGVQDAEATLLAQANTQQLEQARQLRSHLRQWAQANRSLLQSMVQARPDELTALIAVYNSLQRLPFPLWDGDPRLGNGTEDAPFAIALPSRLTLPHLQQSQELMETRMRRDFTEDRDLAVAQSGNVGPAHLTLWASGRVTRTTVRDQFMGHGRIVRIGSSEQQEIMPAFFGTGRAVDMVTTAETPKATTPQLPIHPSVPAFWGRAGYAAPREKSLIGTAQPLLKASDRGDDPATLTFKGHPVVVLDPGHGGQDTGAVGAGGVTEKSLNLEIAQRLRAELQRRGASVFLTRDGDVYLPSTERLRLAAQRHADYFLSLHCDVWASRPALVRQYQNVWGTGTFVYYHGQDDEQHRLAHSIGLMIGQAMGLTPNTVASDSTRFPTGFYVLREAHTPAALVECGYMNNPQELARLRDPRDQQRLVQGIAAGLAAFQVQG